MRQKFGKNDTVCLSKYERGKKPYIAPYILVIKQLDIRYDQVIEITVMEFQVLEYKISEIFFA